MQDHLRIIARLSEKSGIRLPVMLCFFTGAFPQFAAPMRRDPLPAIGTVFDANFADVLARGLTENHSVHDGALMIRRENIGGHYSIAGWSYRLFPPDNAMTAVNRGSAFNSCLAMSGTEGVDDLYLVSQAGTFWFQSGSVHELMRCENRDTYSLSYLLLN